MKNLAIIPARFGSTRFPGKPLAKIGSRTMLEIVWKAAKDASLVDEVLVATDSKEIFAAVHAFGGKPVITSSVHRSGTERAAEVAKRAPAENVIIVQCDEPLLRPGTIDEILRTLDDPAVDIGSAARPRGDVPSFKDRDRVKVVTDRAGFALYFSRSPIPFRFDGHFLVHVGVYAFRTKTLLELAAAAPTPLERAEDLEQLRALELGKRIKLVSVGYPIISVDTPADLVKVQELFAPHRS